MKDLVNDSRDIARELARKYSTMTHDELDVLESILVPMKFAKGQMILSEGEICKHVYYIERGLIRQFYFKNGKQITEHLGEDRSIFMCIESLFREEPTKLQVEALEPTWVYALPKQKLEQVALHNAKSTGYLACTAGLYCQLSADDTRNIKPCSFVNIT